MLTCQTFAISSDQSLRSAKIAIYV